MGNFNRKRGSTMNDLLHNVLYWVDVMEGKNEWEPHWHDLEHIIGPDGEYRGSKILITFGGPTIWIYASRQVVVGYWGGERIERSYRDMIGLSDLIAEYVPERIKK